MIFNRKKGSKNDSKTASWNRPKTYKRLHFCSVSKRARLQRKKRKLAFFENMRVDEQCYFVDYRTIFNFWCDFWGRFGSHFWTYFGSLLEPNNHLCPFGDPWKPICFCSGRAIWLWGTSWDQPGLIKKTRRKKGAKKRHFRVQNGAKTQPADLWRPPLTQAFNRCFSFVHQKIVKFLV